MLSCPECHRDYSTSPHGVPIWKECKYCGAVLPVPNVPKKGFWESFSDDVNRRSSEKAARKPKYISAVGDRSAGILACPSCGGTQFKAKRRGAAKLIGLSLSPLGALAMPKTRVKCITCGKEYLRG